MKFKLIAVLVICLLVGMGLFVLTAAPSTTAVSIPSPNGYDALVQAGDQMSPVPPDYYETTDVDALRGCLDQNQASLAFVDKAIDQDFVIPPAELADLEELTEDVGRFRNLSRVLIVKARVAEMEDRPADAADTLAKIILLGDRLDRGGLLIHALTAVAIKGSGMAELSKLVPKLTAEKRLELLALLETSLDQSKDIDDELEEILIRENEQAKNRMGRIAVFLSSLQGAGVIEPAKQAARSAMERSQRERDELFDALRSTQSPE